MCELKSENKLNNWYNIYKYKIEMITNAVSYCPKINTIKNAIIKL